MPARRLAFVSLFGVIACKNVESGVVFDPTTSSSSGAEEVTTNVSADSTTMGGGETTTSTTASPETTSEGGETTTTSGAESSTTGAPADACGNGILQRGEQCDDDNDVNNDGCSNDCALPGEGLLLEYYGSPGGLDDSATGIAVDSEGNIVIVGNTETLGIHVAKYDPTGTLLWQVVDPGLLGTDTAYDVAIDSNDDVLVTGSVFVSNYDVWVAKYAGANGQQTWERTHSGPVSTTDQGHAVVVDADDNVYVGGYEFVSQQGRNVWLAKYDTDGIEQWTASYDGAATGTDEVSSIELDVDGNIVLAGFTEVDAEDTNIFVAKYDADGNPIWQDDHDAGLAGSDIGWGVGALPDGALIVVGATQVSYDILMNPVYDMWLGRYTTDGTLEWETTIDGPLMGEDIAEEVAVDSLGNFVVVGTMAYDEDSAQSVWYGQPPERRGWIRKFDPDANELWTYTFSPESRWTWAYDVSLEADDDIYVAGRAPQNGAQLDPDMMFLKLSP